VELEAAVGRVVDEHLAALVVPDQVAVALDIDPAVGEVLTGLARAVEDVAGQFAAGGALLDVDGLRPHVRADLVVQHALFRSLRSGVPPGRLLVAEPT
jgi:hypothetical protein